ncbi:four helix bundle protein [candidate division WOR-3 bacterium]|nr:four helix bundle protein [candidate division WOR-3 bacterium]
MRDLKERLLDFATACLKLHGKLSHSAPGRYIAGQMMRSSSSAGANYHEASGAESRADFAHKLQIVLKELRETEYWLKLAGRGGLLSLDDVKPAATEADELARIIAKSVITTKSRA